MIPVCCRPLPPFACLPIAIHPRVTQFLSGQPIELVITIRAAICAEGDHRQRNRNPRRSPFLLAQAKSQHQCISPLSGLDPPLCFISSLLSIRIWPRPLILGPYIGKLGNQFLIVRDSNIPGLKPGPKAPPPFSPGIGIPFLVLGSRTALHLRDFYLLLFQPVVHTGTDTNTVDFSQGRTGLPHREDNLPGVCMVSDIGNTLRIRAVRPSGT